MATFRPDNNWSNIVAHQAFAMGYGVQNLNIFENWKSWFYASRITDNQSILYPCEPLTRIPIGNVSILCCFLLIEIMIVRNSHYWHWMFVKIPENSCNFMIFIAAMLFQLYLCLGILRWYWEYDELQSKSPYMGFLFADSR